MSENKYVVFNEVPNTPGRKTKKFEVSNINGYPLGFISFWGAWRQYTFQPLKDTVFDIKCLREIINQIEYLNTEIRLEWKAKAKLKGGVEE